MWQFAILYYFLRMLANLEKVEKIFPGKKNKEPSF